MNVNILVLLFGQIRTTFMNCREENCEFIHGGGEYKHVSAEVFNNL